MTGKEHSTLQETFFDAAAQSYDVAFTYTFVGKEQRRVVWHYIDLHLKAKGKKLRILELNCGTGEDALFMGKQGHEVLATDLSPEMITIARAKASKLVLPNLSFQVLDIKQLDQLEGGGGPFDLVFSNFGGLNCLSSQQLQSLSKDVFKLLSSEGIFFAVIMSRKCYWERLYFLMKGNLVSRNRRLSNCSIDVVVDGTVVPTWFYSPKEVITLFTPLLHHIYTKPVGIGIPPSYLNAMFEKYSLMRILAKGIEKMLGSFSSLSNRADHFLITFTKR